MPLTEPIKPLRTYIRTEAAGCAFDWGQPLSGYKAGYSRGGRFVRELEDKWADKLHIKHAIACNSATSGLLAASAVCGVEWRHQDIAVPCFTMSATAAAPRIAWPDHYLSFMDCDPETYCSLPQHCPEQNIGQIIITNLFGQAGALTQWRMFADRLGVPLIEDASQAPFAISNDNLYAGTVGDVGVFSFNVHKHIQCGEGGMIVTDDDDLAERLRGYVNHGECLRQSTPGLNLRMTEYCALLVLDQLDRAEDIIGSRIELADELSDMVRDFWAPPVREGRHVFYIWAVRVPNRDKVVPFLQAEGIPVRAGYVDPLYRLAAFSDWATKCPNAEKAHDKDLMIFEICSWDPDKQQLKEMKEIFKRASEL